MLSFAPTPIGNLDDLSFRALDRLAKAEVFLCEDTRVTKRLISLLKRKFPVQFFENPTFFSVHSHNEEQAIASLDRAIFDRPCVFVSDAGMPCVSDPGSALVKWCQENGIEYEVLPGANAAITAYAASGFGESKFVFYGFLPHKLEARTKELEAVLKLPFAAILYESPHRIEDFAELIAKLAPDRAIAAFKELTKLHEKRFVGKGADLPSAIAAMTPKGEWTVLIAPAEKLADENDWLIAELVDLPAPAKPLAKILSKLSNRKPTEWYNFLQNQRGGK